MAVATHVSRVAKEYAPFGYSVMEDVTYVLTDSVAPAEGTEILGYVDDADIYVESAQLFVTSGAATGGADTAGITIQYADNDGSLTNTTDISTELQSGLMGNNTANNLTITNPIIPSQKLVLVEWDNETGTAAPTGMVLKLRIRRKA